MWAFAVSIVCLCMGSTAAEQTGNYEDCYYITPTIMLGIVAADLFLTMLLLIPVYYCIRPKGRKQSDMDEKNNYINMIGKHT
ncbi:hematopoietic cell signal transducer-like [Elgaria multicarinata webbii]|uniref:hematopoietic cell signal transducer-like n=1 Tax=Elgaria multicarinata webbii TaxID=159646 RepID=UPI002FCCC1D2